MHIDLSGRSALVTGSTRGIGYAIASALYAAGAQVVINGRNLDSVRRAIERLGAEHSFVGAPLVAAPADLSHPDGCAQLIHQVIGTIDSVDILVNSVGAYSQEQGLDTPLSEWEKSLYVNALNGLELATAFLDDMVKRDRHGRIIWISSNNALMPRPTMAPYSVAKLVQVSLADMIGQVVGGTSVTSTVVFCGPTRTDGLDVLVADRYDPDLDEGYRQLMADHTTSLRLHPSTPEEIAALVTFLASPHSAGIRRGGIRYDGGYIPTVV